MDLLSNMRGCFRIPLVAVLVAVMALTACTGPAAPSNHPPRGTARTTTSPESSPGPTHAGRPTVSAPPAAKISWTYDEQRPMTRFEAVDGVLIGMTLRNKLLRITALDPRNGHVLWDKPASPGYNPPGVSPEVLVMGKQVVYLEPVSSKYHFWTYVVVAEARTGRTVTTTKDDFEIDGLPEPCGDLLCFDGYRDAPGDNIPEESWVMNPLTGAVHSTTGSKEIADGYWRAIGDGGLIELGDGEIARQVKGKVRWHRPWHDFFGRDFTSASGWEWEYDAKHHIFSGEIGWHPKDIRTRVEDLTTSSIMVGLDSRTGKLRWKDVGVTRWCTADDLLAELPEGYEDYRCRYRSGTNDYHKNVKTWLKNVGVTVEQFDHVTNKINWKVALDPYTVSDDYAEPMVRILDDQHLLGWQHRHVIAIDLRDGTTATMPSDTGGWCADGDDVAYAVSPYKEAGKDRLTGTLLMPCGPDGKRTKITRLPPRSLSATIGGIRAVTGKRSVTGLRAA